MTGPHFNRIRRRLLAWYDRNRRALPWRGRRRPYAIWIAETMLQQTQVQTVLPYYRRFLKSFPTLRALDRAPLGKVLAHWSGLGYYRRAENLKKAAGIIVRRHGGRIPADYEQLLALPGIGSYTAGALMSIAFNEPYPALDGNVRRVIGRLLGIPAKAGRGPSLPAAADRFLPRRPAAPTPKGGDATVRAWQDLHGRASAPSRLNPRPANGNSKGIMTNPEKDLELAAAVLVAPRRPGDFNQAMMDLGATICLPREPNCRKCPLSSFCAEHKQSSGQKFTSASARKSVRVEWPLLVIVNDGRLLLRRRPAGGLLGGLWEVPGGEKRPGESLRAAVNRHLGELREHALSIVPAGEVRHSITYRRIVAPIFRAAVDADLPLPGELWRWVPVSRLSRYAMSSLSLKAARRFHR